MGKYILIVGATGVGKSSIINHIQSIKPSLVYSDPYNDNPFISDAYKNRNSAFQSQIFFFKEFLKIHKRITMDVNVSNILQERSIFESIYIFCSNYLLEGVFSQDEYNLMEELLNEVTSDFIRPHSIIYLKASPETIINRINRRGRLFEKSIDTQFIKRQISLYEDWLPSQVKYWNCNFKEFDTDLESISIIGNSIITQFLS